MMKVPADTAGLSPKDWMKIRKAANSLERQSKNLQYDDEEIRVCIQMYTQSIFEENDASCWDEGDLGSFIGRLPGLLGGIRSLYIKRERHVRLSRKDVIIMNHKAKAPSRSTDRQKRLLWFVAGRMRFSGIDLLEHRFPKYSKGIDWEQLMGEWNKKNPQDCFLSQDSFEMAVSRAKRRHGEEYLMELSDSLHNKMAWQVLRSTIARSNTIELLEIMKHDKQLENRLKAYSQSDEFEFDFKINPEDGTIESTIKNARKVTWYIIQTALEFNLLPDKGFAEYGPTEQPEESAE